MTVRKFNNYLRTVRKLVPDTDQMSGFSRLEDINKGIKGQTVLQEAKTQDIRWERIRRLISSPDIVYRKELIELSEEVLGQDRMLLNEYHDWLDAFTLENSVVGINTSTLAMLLVLYEQFMQINEENTLVSNLFASTSDRIVGFSIIIEEVNKNNIQLKTRNDYGQLLLDLASGVNRRLRKPSMEKPDKMTLMMTEILQGRKARVA